MRKSKDTFFAQVTREITHLDISANARLLYIEFMLYGKRIYPGIDTLASDLGLARSTVIRAIGELEARGLITTHKTKGRVNQYSLVSPNEAKPNQCQIQTGTSPDLTRVPVSDSDSKERKRNREIEREKVLDPKEGDLKMEHDNKSAAPRNRMKTLGYKFNSKLFVQDGEGPKAFLDIKEVEQYRKTLTDRYGYAFDRKMGTYQDDEAIWIWNDVSFTLANLNNRAEKFRIDRFIEAVA